jgi:DNA-binding Lrp family transcriptional regulator
MVSKRLAHTANNSEPISKMDNEDTARPQRLSRLIDDINLKIIEELVKNPSTTSSSLSTKLEIPLSSLQRRRAKIEKYILNKSYQINLRSISGKIGEVVINVKKGKSREVAKQILKKFRNNVMSVSTRINAEHNVAAHIMYNDTAELHALLESIKSMPFVSHLQWSEIVEVIGDNSHVVMSAFFVRSKPKFPI